MEEELETENYGYKKQVERLLLENERLNNIIDKANNILKDTNVDMPETLLIETIDYARHILNGEYEKR